MKLIHAIIISISLVVCSCQSKQFDNFDSKLWKADKKGCNGTRKALIEQILKRKSEIYGFTEVDVLKNFGTPDMNDLRRRQQKFYYYYIYSAEHCPDDSISRTLKFKFNAIDQVQEVLYE
ncbi:MAG TPA: hypothetical protein VL947_07490 [Cytophagales bacterium]|nr:hypothetical protein [Cytophagales bacterium]